MVEIPKYDKIPPVVRYHGNIEEAKRHRGEALHVLNRLRTQKSFQGLSQDVLRRKLDDGVKVVTRYVMNTPYVDIYAPIIKEEIEEKEEELKACFIQPLSYTVKPFPGDIPPPDCIDAVGFCLTADEDCNMCLSKWGRKLEKGGDGFIQNLAQCKYKYIENEDDEITRRASLFHYDFIWPMGGYDRKVRVVNYKNCADFELKIPIYIPPGGVVDLCGALSKDLTKLYISLYSATGYIPLKERSLQYQVYNLVEGEWKLIKSGKTPIGYSYVDNVVTRDGNCGCWQLDITEGDKEVFVYADTLQEDSCCPAGHDASGAGGKSFKSGTVVNARFVTFSLESESFISSSKMKGYHMSPYLKDYAVCLAHEIAVYEFGGALLGLTEAECVCRTHSCPHCVIWGDTIRLNRLSYNKIYEEFNGGTVTLYHLYNGLETYAPLWTRFFTNYYYLLEDSLKIERTECPCPETGCAHYLSFGSGYIYQGYGFSDLGSGYTTYVYRNVNTNEREVTWSGNCGHDGSCEGYNLLPLCKKTAPNWVCKTFGVGCHETLDDPGFANVKEKRLLSPLTMVLQDGESIGNTFISYDEETDSLIRGVRYKALDGKWYWYIKAKIPVRDDEEPFSVIKDCEDKKIDQELKLLLSDEHYSRLEAIIFIEDIKEK